MKTIALLHVADTLNYGTMMMGEVLIYHLNKILGENLKFRIVTSKAEETYVRLREALKNKVSEDTIEVFYDPPSSKWGRVTQAIRSSLRLGDVRDLFPWVKGVDLILVLGGDIYTESYGYKGPLYYLSVLTAFERVGIPVVMMGQTVGPFYSWREPLAKSFLRKLSLIISRDPLTFAYLKERLNIPNVELGADLAFAELARERENLSVPLNNVEEFICIVPSELLWRYGIEHDRGLYVRTLVQISEKILYFRPKASLVLLPHVLSPSISDDRRLMRDLYEALKQKPLLAGRVYPIESELLPFQARAILGQALFVITGRMHAAISAFTQGVPAISLAYSEKYLAIFGEYLGLPELVIDVRQHPWSLIEQQVVQKSIELMAGPQRVDKIERIERHVSLMRNRVEKMLHLLVEKYLS